MCAVCQELCAQCVRSCVLSLSEVVCSVCQKLCARCVRGCCARCSKICVLGASIVLCSVCPKLCAWCVRSVVFSVSQELFTSTNPWSDSPVRLCMVQLFCFNFDLELVVSMLAMSNHYNIA